MRSVKWRAGAEGGAEKPCETAPRVAVAGRCVPTREPMKPIVCPTTTHSTMTCQWGRGGGGRSLSTVRRCYARSAQANRRLVGEAPTSNLARRRRDHCCSPARSAALLIRERKALPAQHVHPVANDSSSALAIRTQRRRRRPHQTHLVVDLLAEERHLKVVNMIPWFS